MGTSKGLTEHKVTLDPMKMRFYHKRRNSYWYEFRALIDGVPVKCKCIIAFQRHSLSGLTVHFRFDKPIIKHPDYESIRLLIKEALLKHAKFNHKCAIDPDWEIG